MLHEHPVNADLEKPAPAVDRGPYLSREALPCYPTETLTDTRHVPPGPVP